MLTLLHLSLLKKNSYRLFLLTSVIVFTVPLFSVTAPCKKIEIDSLKSIILNGQDISFFVMEDGSAVPEEDGIAGIHRRLKRVVDNVRKHKTKIGGNIVSVGLTLVFKDKKGKLEAFYDRFHLRSKEEEVEKIGNPLSFLSGLSKKGELNMKLKNLSSKEDLYSMSPLKRGSDDFDGSKLEGILHDLVVKAEKQEETDFDLYPKKILNGYEKALGELAKSISDTSKPISSRISHLDKLKSDLGKMVGSATDSEQVFLKYLQTDKNFLEEEIKALENKRLAVKDQNIVENLRKEMLIKRKNGIGKFSYEVNLSGLYDELVAVFVNLHSEREICEFCGSCINKQLLLYHKAKKRIEEEAKQREEEKGCFWYDLERSQPTCMVLASFHAGGFSEVDNSEFLDIDRMVNEGWFPQFSLTNKKRRGTPKKLELKENA